MAYTANLMQDESKTKQILLFFTPSRNSNKKSVIYLQSKCPDSIWSYISTNATLMCTLFIIIVHISLNSHKYLQEKRILFVEKAK